MAVLLLQLRGPELGSVGDREALECGAATPSLGSYCDSSQPSICCKARCGSGVVPAEGALLPDHLLKCSLRKLTSAGLRDVYGEPA